MDDTACPGSDRKFRTRADTTSSNPPSRLGSASDPATTNDTRASETFFRACSMNGSDGSQATTEAGSQRSQMVDVRAPVPHPTSSHVAERIGRSHSTNARASARLQRPMYASYASPATHLSRGAFVTSILRCPFSSSRNDSRTESSASSRVGNASDPASEQPSNDATEPSAAPRR